MAFYIALIVRFAFCEPITAVLFSKCLGFTSLHIHDYYDLFEGVVWVAGFKLFANLVIFRRFLLVFLDPACCPGTAELYYQDFLCL